MGLALDEEHVYFANGSGTVSRVSKAGGPTSMVASSVGQFPGGLATDGTTLYIGAFKKLVTVPLAGGAADALAVGLGGAGCVAVDDTSVYIADQSGDAIVKVAK
jgi:hypothetical protein